jgi:hypothetical protein
MGNLAWPPTAKISRRKRCRPKVLESRHCEHPSSPHADQRHRDGLADPVHFYAAFTSQRQASSMVHFASAIYTLLPATGHWLAKPLNRFPRNDSHSEEQKHGVEKREPTEPGGPLLASVFVPTRAENYYMRKIEAYRDEETRRGRPKNEALISRIDTIRLATRDLPTKPVSQRTRRRARNA